MITLILLVLSLCINGVLAWTTYVQYAKNNAYELQLMQADQQIAKVFDKVSRTLIAMRTLDEKRMFESDDEVGTVFQQLADIVNDMRPMLYGADDEEV